MSNDGKHDSDTVQVITPSHTIRNKVSGSGGPSKAMLEQAQAAITKMAGDYPVWAVEDVERLSRLIDSAKPGDGSGCSIMEDAYKLAHDMRGQGGSFGYPLMTRIATSFCRFVEELQTVDVGSLQICQAHVQSMRAVLTNRVSGSGGAIGAQIADSLELAVQKYKDKHSL